MFRAVQDRERLRVTEAFISRSAKTLESRNDVTPVSCGVVVLSKG